jgi:hypothetical protein
VSAVTRVIGTALLAALFVGLEGLVTAWCGARPASFTGVEVGAAIGLASLVLEIQIVERALRSARGDTASATFQTFAMRLAIVAPLTILFQRKGSGIDGSAFAVSYLVTFFVYLCWLTWKSYHAPVQYRGRSARFAPRVVERRSPVATGSRR